ncbi:MAG: aminopeptidase P family protein [Limnochordaceae bacterium]|nr:aminopeptidase P family protein [Limnochordaceae bacterium]
MDQAEEIRARVEAMARKVSEMQVDAMVVAAYENRRYLTGFTGSAGVAIVSRDPGERPVLLVDSRYTEQARAQAVGWEVIQHGDYVWEAMRDVLQRIGARKVAFEADHVTVRQASRWQQEMGQFEWVPVEQQVEALRAVKSPWELERMRRAVAITDEAFSYILTVIRPGITEKEVAWRLEVFMREQGAERLAFDTIVGSGPNGALPHAYPTDRAIQPGDLVVLDFGCVTDGYHSDMTRTVAVAPVSAKAREIYDLVRRSQETGVQAVRPGRTGQEVDALARAVIEEAGLGPYFGHGLGHGVGLEIHEPIPRLSRVSDGVLVPGMVTSVEPGVYLPGWGGVRIEDLVVVTEGGCEVLTSSPKDLQVVGGNPG